MGITRKIVHQKFKITLYLHKQEWLKWYQIIDTVHGKFDAFEWNLLTPAFFVCFFCKIQYEGMSAILVK